MESRINMYHERGLIRGKLYISSRVAKRLKPGSKGGRVELIYGGRSYTVSLCKASKNRGGAKLYIPKEVLDDVIQRGAEGAVIEVEREKITILHLIKFCKICGEVTTSRDGLCMGRHFKDPGVCVRCGRPLHRHRLEGDGILCDECVRAYAQVCGLSEWYEPSPMGLFDDGNY